MAAGGTPRFMTGTTTYSRYDKRMKKLGRVTQEGRTEFVRVLKKQSLKQKMEKVAADEIGVEEGAALLQEVLTEAGIATFGVAKERRGESGARGFPVNEWFGSARMQGDG
jgi:hypothetical protein